MLRAGYIDWSDRGDFYGPTEHGASLKESGLKPRIDRGAAEAVLARTIEKARAWNADTTRPVANCGVRLFGSMLEDRATYGDGDIELVFADRDLPEARINELVDAIPYSARRSIFFSIDPEGSMRSRHRRQAQVALQRGATSLSTTAPAPPTEPSPTHHPQVTRCQRREDRQADQGT